MQISRASRRGTEYQGKSLMVRSAALTATPVETGTGSASGERFGNLLDRVTRVTSGLASLERDLHELTRYIQVLQKMQQVRALDRKGRDQEALKKFNQELDRMIDSQMDLMVQMPRLDAMIDEMKAKEEEQYLGPHGMEWREYSQKMDPFASRESRKEKGEQERFEAL